MKIAVCLKGTEDIIAKDLKGKKLLDGRIAFTKSKNLSGVMVVYDLIEQFKFKDYEDLIKNVSGIKFKFKGSFRVDCKREGEHDFDSGMIERGVGEIIYNAKFKVDLKNPDNTIYVDVINKDCLIGILEAKDLHKRDYKARINNQSLNACLAYFMLKLLGKGDLIDPFCRDGVIAIEAARMKLGKVYAWDENYNNLKNAETNVALAEAKVKFCKPDEVNGINVATFLPIASFRNKFAENDTKIFFEKLKSKRMVICTLNRELLDKYCKMKIVSERKIIIGDFKYSILELSRL